MGSNLTQLIIYMLVFSIGSNFNSNSGKTTVGPRLLQWNVDPPSFPTQCRAMGKRGHQKVPNLGDRSGLYYINP